MTRRMAATETPESLIFYSALAPVILMLPTVPYQASLPPDAFHWLILLSLGFYGAFGHWLLIRAYRMATTSALAPYPYLQMVWMIVLRLGRVRPVARPLDARRRGDHRGERPLHRASRAPVAAEEQHRAQQRRRGAGKKALKRRRRMA